MSSSLVVLDPVDRRLLLEQPTRCGRSNVVNRSVGFMGLSFCDESGRGDGHKIMLPFLHDVLEDKSDSISFRTS